MKAAEGKLFQVYFHELFWLATVICDNCQTIFDETDPPTDGHFIKVDPDVHARISAVLRDAANIKKLVGAPETKSKGVSRAAFTLRKERAAILRQAIEGVDLDEIMNPKVRNSIEHFDEYLDAANLMMHKTNESLPPIAAYNMTLSSWDLMSPHPYPVRLYIADEQKFYNLKYSVDLGRIHGEALGIKKKLMEGGHLGGVEEPGGLMVRIVELASAGSDDEIVLRTRRR